jgi:hypothetical protein
MNRRPDMGPVEVRLLLFHDDGTPVRGNTGEICPRTGCVFLLAAGQTLRTTIEELADEDTGGLLRDGPEGSVIVNVTGLGTDATELSLRIVSGDAGPHMSVTPLHPMLMTAKRASMNNMCNVRLAGSGGG